MLLGCYKSQFTFNVKIFGMHWNTQLFILKKNLKEEQGLSKNSVFSLKIYSIYTLLPLSSRSAEDVPKFPLLKVI